MSDDLGRLTVDELRGLVEEADLSSLLAALAYVTGDVNFVPESLWLDPSRLLEPEGGWDAEQVEQARHLAIGGLRHLSNRTADPFEPDAQESDSRTTDLRESDNHTTDLRESEARTADIRTAGIRESGAGRGDASLVSRLVDWLTGTQLDDDYRTMLTEELAIGGDQRIPEPIDTRNQPAFRGPGPTVAVIGAGMSGILAAHRLQQAGLDFVVLEKNDDVGGTWLENTYPGCRVDVFNHVYSYAGEQRPDWPEYHSSQQVLLDYFRDCAHRWGIVDRIRFETQVESLTWDDHALRWHIRSRTSSGHQVVTVAAVISAVGQLNRPMLPAIEGIEDFAGEWFHSSAWRHDIDWRCLRVAVIGTGASAMQFVPHLAEAAARLTVFQRTPPWLIPRPEYHEPLPQGLLRLFEAVPGYANWFRLRLFWRTHEGTVNALRRDQAWTGPLHQAVSEQNELMRLLLTGYLESEFSDRPDLLAKVVPDYPVGAKRVVLDNGVWARTLKQPHVELVTEPIDRITSEGVLGADGRLHPADVIVYGTGFRASEFLMPMRVTGRGGVDLHETWAGDARAYMGACVPGFPNLFCLYGPNTNIVINGSIVYFSECSVHYAIECLRLLAERGATAMDCRSSAYDRYSRKVDDRNAEMAWGISKVNSWYKSPSGRVAQNWPFPLIDFWRQTRQPDDSAYEFL